MEREWLNIPQLQEYGPWSAQTIRNMICAGEFKKGVHFYYPFGKKRKPIFSRKAVDEFIKGRQAAELKPEDMAVRPHPLTPLEIKRMERLRRVG